MSKHGLLLQRLLVLGLGLLFAVLWLEGLLRLVGLGQRLGKAFLLPDPAATVVLCVGDSYTACPGVPRDKAYPAQLEQQLNADHPRRRFQVLNLGLNGQNSSSLRSELAANLHTYHPAVVVLLTGGANAWDYTGYQAFLEADSSTARWLDSLGRIRVLKLARLVLVGLQGGNLGQPPKPSGPPRLPPQSASKRVRELDKKGDALCKDMDFPAAERCFRQALALDPGDAPAWIGLALICAETGRFEEGLKPGLEGLRLDPSATRSYRILARLYRARNEREKALDCYLTGLERGDEACDPGEKARLLEGLMAFAQPDERARFAGRLQAILDAQPQLQSSLPQGAEQRRDQPRLGDWIATDLGQALETCRQANVPVILMNYPVDHPRNLGGLYERVAREESVPFVDNMRAFEGVDEARFFLPDGHCTEKGNALVASKVKPVLLEVLGRAGAGPGKP